MEETGIFLYISNNSEHMRDIFARLNDMRKAEELVDCSLKTDDGTVFPVHKIILLTSSEYFASLCRQREGNSPMEFSVPGIKPTTMAIILDFIYSQHVKIPSGALWDLLVAAVNFQFKSLIEHCHHWFTTNLNLTDCALVYQRSKQHQLAELANHVKCYIVKNFDKIFPENEHLMNLTADDLVEILVDDHITCKEEYLWNVAKTWLEKCPDSRKHFAPQLLRSIRLGFLDTDFVFTNVMRHPFVFLNSKCKEIVSERMELMWDIAEMMSMKHVHTKYIAKPRLPKDLLFCVGGYEDSSEKAAGIIEVFDSKADIWCEINEDLDCVEHIKRYGHACVMLEYCLYVIGGQESNGVVHSSVHCLDLLKKQWIVIPQMIKARYGISAVVSAGSIIVMGGSQGSNVFYSVETYNPKDNKWAFLGCLKKPRCWAGASVLGGRIYISGGTSNHLNSLKSAEEFDPETGTWKQIASMKECRQGLSSVTFQGNIFAAGGSGLQSVERYNPEQNSWTIVSHMRQPRNYFSLTVLDGAMFAIGGSRKNPEDIEIYCDSEVFNESTNIWRPADGTIHRLKKSGCCAAYDLPNIQSYLYKNRENVLEVKRKLLFESKLKGVDQGGKDLTQLL